MISARGADAELAIIAHDGVPSRSSGINGLEEAL